MEKYIFAVVVVLVCGIVLGIALAFASKYLKVEENPHAKNINEMLPGVNCGACGFRGCSGLAKALAEGKCSKASECKVIKGAKLDALQAYIDSMNQK